MIERAVSWNLLGSLTIDDFNENLRRRNKLKIWLMEQVITNVLQVRHALRKNSVPSSAKQQRQITPFADLTKTCANNIKTSIAQSCIYFNDAPRSPLET